MNMINHTRLDLVEGGSIFKQGEHAQLAFNPRDYSGKTVDLTGKDIAVAIWNDKGIMYEGTANFDSTAQLIRLTINQLLQHGDFQIEFTVTDAADPDYRQKFPSGEYEGKIYIKPSADNIDFVGVSMTTVAQLRSEQENKQTQFERQIVPQVDEIKTEQQRLQIELYNAAAALTEDSEFALAKGTYGSVPERLNSSDQRLERKAEKDEIFTMENMGQDIKTAMTGGSVPVVGENSVNSVNVNLDAITPSEVDFIEKSRNLLHKSYLKPNAINSVDGKTIDSSAVYHTEKYMRVNPNTILNKNKLGGVFFYDSSKNHITAPYRSMSTPAGNVIVPSNAYFMRLNVYSYDINSYQIEVGSTASAYTEGKNKLKPSVIVEDANITSLEGKKIKSKTLELTKLKEFFTGINLVNKANSQDGYVDRANGVIVTNSGNTAVAYIPLVTEETVLRLKPLTAGSTNLVFYDENLGFISKAAGGYTDQFSLTTHPLESDWSTGIPSNAAYFSVSFHSTEINNAMAYAGNEIKEFESYYGYLKGVTPRDAAATVINKTKLTVSVTSENVAITIPQTNVMAIEFNFSHKLKVGEAGATYSNGDSWYMQVAYLVKFDGNGDEIERTALVTQGAWETAISIEGYVDFIGTIHGYEQLDRLYIYVNGHPVENGMHEADDVKIISAVRLIEQGSTDTLAATTFRTYTFNMDGVKIKQRFEWAKGYTMNNPYLVMLPIYRDGVTHTAISEKDFIEYDVSMPDANVSINAQHPDVHWVHIFGDELGVTVSVDYKDLTIPNVFNVSPAAQYNKLYFSYGKGHTVSPGDIWEVSALYNFKAI